MKLIIFLTFIYVCFCIQDATVTILTDSEFQTQMKDGVLIDLRTIDEIQTNGYIQNAFHLDFYSDNLDQKIDQMVKSQKYFLYCQSGVRSEKFALMLSFNKFLYIYELKSGFNQWYSDKLPIINNSEKPIKELLP